MGIIGVVSVLTLQSLIQKTNDREYNASRQALLTRFSDAIRLMSLNNELTSSSDAEDFVKNYLSKYMKIAEFGTNHPDKITAINGKTYNKSVYAQGGYSPTKYGFVLNNGYTVYLYYNPKCINDCLANCYAANTVCINAIYDMNGLKGPNKAGKDIGFITAFYPDDTKVVAPLLHSDITKTGTFNEAGQICSSLDKDTHVPLREEALGISLNASWYVGTRAPSKYIWTPYTIDKAQNYPTQLKGMGASIQDDNSVFIRASSKNSSLSVYCVKY